MVASGCLRLCSLINDSLLQFPQSKTLGNEQELLVSLSQVLNEIWRWTNEVECKEDEGSGCGSGSGGCNLHSGDHECLTNIVVGLVIFALFYTVFFGAILQSSNNLFSFQGEF